MSGTAERLIDFIRDLNQRAVISDADLDELQILHNHCRHEFPDVFNELAEYRPNDGNPRKVQMERLLRIHEVDQSIPETDRVFHGGSDEDDLVPTFTLQEADVIRINHLCDKMRKIILASDIFDVPHRKRLLNRIAAIEAEILKPKGLFDVIRGGVSDIGETLGKFGVDIKPLTDRMQEVVGIARRHTKAYEQLPPPEDLPKLPRPEGEAGKPS